MPEKILTWETVDSKASFSLVHQNSCPYVRISISHTDERPDEVIMMGLCELWDFINGETAKLTISDFLGISRRAAQSQVMLSIPVELLDFYGKV